MFRSTDRMPALDDSQIDQYRRRGFLCPVPALTHAEVEQVRQQLEDWDARLTGASDGSFKFVQPHLHLAWAADLVGHPGILDVIESLIGPDILVHSTTVFAKPPGSATPVAWHQDGYRWGMDDDAMVSAWIALTRSDESNGCVRVVDGRRDRVEHVDARGPATMLRWGLQVRAAIDERETVPLILAPGEMSLHHIHTIHASGPNHSNAPRLGFAIRYCSARIRQTAPHHAVLLVRGRARHDQYRLAPRPEPRSLAASLANYERFLAEHLAWEASWKR